MYACIYHINFKIRVTVQTTNLFEQTKKQKSLILRAKLVQQHTRDEFSKTLLRPPPR